MSDHPARYDAGTATPIVADFETSTSGDIPGLSVSRSAVFVDVDGEVTLKTLPVREMQGDAAH
jgi:hypothetical protein